MSLTFGSLFSGIGGIDLGFERAGMKCVWQSEINSYASKVLKKHWPHVPNYGDITAVDWSKVETPDIIAGGFPCQDISNAGKREGIHGERSGLFFELMRCVRVVRPRIVILENVAALLVRGMDVVLAELSESGYNAEWQTLFASNYGVPQLRTRIFIIANSYGVGLEAYANKSKVCQQANRSIWHDGYSESGVSEEFLYSVAGKRTMVSSDTRLRAISGFPSRVDRLRCLGNAVVPQVAEFIGKLIVENLDNATR